jgi:hypothetical protein
MGAVASVASADDCVTDPLQGVLRPGQVEVIVGNSLFDWNPVANLRRQLSARPSI